jgi:hypothetical protein
MDLWIYLWLYTKLTSSGELTQAGTKEMKKIFISYRRDDSSYAADTIHDRFITVFGHKNVFMDVVDIHGGDKWEERIKNALDAADCFVPLIGKTWLSNPRLHDPRDVLRGELETAIERRIAVIPALLDGFRWPSDAENQLPTNSSLRTILPSLQYETVDPPPDSQTGLGKLVRAAICQLVMQTARNEGKWLRWRAYLWWAWWTSWAVIQAMEWRVRRRLQLIFIYVMVMTLISGPLLCSYRLYLNRTIELGLSGFVADWKEAKKNHNLDKFKQLYEGRPFTDWNAFVLRSLPSSYKVVAEQPTDRDNAYSTQNQIFVRPIEGRFRGNLTKGCRIRVRGVLSAILNDDINLGECEVEELPTDSEAPK